MVVIVPLPLSHIEEREIAMGMPRQPSVLSSQHFWTDFVCWETPEFGSHISAQKHAMPFSVLDATSSILWKWDCGCHKHLYTNKNKHFSNT